MLFNNKKPEEHVTDTIPLKRDPQPSADPTHAKLRMSGGAPSRSVIDACLVITGNLQSERDVQVDGELNGDIRCSQLIVSRDATINGNIVAHEVVVRGKVKGIIRADQVMLQDTAQVESEIFHKSLVIEQGAIFDGQSCRIDEFTRAATNLDPQIADLQAMAADMRSTRRTTARAKRRPPETGGASLSDRSSCFTLRFSIAKAF